MQDSLNNDFDNSKQNLTGLIETKSKNINNASEVARLLIPIASIIYSIVFPSQEALQTLLYIVLDAGQFLSNTIRHPLHTPSNLINFARNLVFHIDNLVTPLSITLLDLATANLAIVKNTFTLKNDPEETQRKSQNLGGLTYQD